MSIVDCQNPEPRIMIEVNEYFDGNVKSLSLKTDTLPATVGVMLPGDYTFNTGDKEQVTIVSGRMDIRLPESDDWNTYNPGDSFKVPANSSFDLKIKIDTAYLCLYG